MVLGEVPKQNARQHPFIMQLLLPRRQRQVVALQDLSHMMATVQCKLTVHPHSLVDDNS